MTRPEPSQPVAHLGDGGNVTRWTGDASADAEVLRLRAQIERMRQQVRNTAIIGLAAVNWILGGQPPLSEAWFEERDHRIDRLRVLARLDADTATVGQPAG